MFIKEMFIKEQKNTIKKLESVFRSYKEVCGDFLIKPEICTIIANAYINSKENNLKDDENRYIASLMLYFWKDLEKLYNKLKYNGYTPEEAHSCIYECIEAACKYRKWEIDKNTNAEACIRRVIKSRGVPRFYTTSNRNNKKANYNTLSLNVKINNDSDSDSEFIDYTTKNCCNEKLEKEKTISHNNVCNFIQNKFDNRKYLEAIFSYVICFGPFEIDKKNKYRKKARYYIKNSYNTIKKSIMDEFDNIDENFIDSCLTNLSKANKEDFSECIDIVFDS